MRFLRVFKVHFYFFNLVKKSDRNEWYRKLTNEGITQNGGDSETFGLTNSRTISKIRNFRIMPK